MKLRYCPYCGIILKENHNCEEEKKALEKKRQNKTQIVRSDDETFEEMILRFQKYKDIDWDRDVY